MCKRLNIKCVWGIQSITSALLLQSPGVPLGIWKCAALDEAGNANENFRAKAIES